MRTRLGIANWTIVMTSFVMMIGVRTFHPPLVHFHSHDNNCHNSSECDIQAASQQTTKSLAGEEQLVHRHGENRHSHNHSGCSASSKTNSKQSDCQSRTADACSTTEKSKSASRARCGHLHTHSTATHRHHNHDHNEESEGAPADGQQDLPCHSESCLLCQFLIQAIQPLDCPVMLTGEERVAERPVSEILEVVTVALSGPYVRGPPQLV